MRLRVQNVVFLKDRRENSHFMYVVPGFDGRSVKGL